MAKKKYKIKGRNGEFDASEYQNAIFDNVEHGSGNMVVTAAAGSAKTTTIVNCINLIDGKKKVLFVAFNKGIANDIKKEVGERYNVKVSTFHSLGYSILMENLGGKIDVNDYKYRTYIKSEIESLTEYGEIKSLGKKRKKYVDNVILLTNYSRYYLAFSLQSIRNVAERYGVAILRDEDKVVRKVLQWGESHVREIDYTDMIWLPNVLNHVTERHRYDWIMVDEAQDTNVAEQKIVEKCFKRGTRFIVVGDSAQQINVWCGASVEAIDTFKSFPHTKEFTLPISYRCPKRIVEKASRYSPNIVARDGAEDGEIRYGVGYDAPVSGDMVLCRNTAPLVELYMRYLNEGIKSYIKGSSVIGENMIRMVDSTFCENVKDIIAKLYEMVVLEIEQVMQTWELDLEDALGHSSVAGLYDSVVSIKVLSKGLADKGQLTERIREVFDDRKGDGVALSTVHKAKGLEADNIYILCPSLMPSPYASQDWEVKTERNLIYVAVTRAKKTLSYMKEDNSIGGNKQKNDATLMKLIKEKGLDTYKPVKHAKESVTEVKPTLVAKPKTSGKRKAGNKYADFL